MCDVNGGPFGRWNRPIRLTILLAAALGLVACADESGGTDDPGDVTSADAVDACVGDGCTADPDVDSCPAGTEGCDCLDDDTCAEGLSCIAGECLLLECTVGAIGCPCSDDGACEPGLGCKTTDSTTDGSTDGSTDSVSTCEICQADAVGCACTQDSGCAGSLICDPEANACRAFVGCEAITCKDFQKCAEATDDADAYCLSECEAPYGWNSTTEQCEEIVITCSDGAPGSIAQACAASYKSCVEGDEDGDAACGECLDGYVSEGELCVVPKSCFDLAAECDAAHKDCAEDESGNASCGGCVSPWTDDGTGTCELTDAVTCEATGTSLLAECTAAGRECVDPDDGPPECGACLDGYQENAAGVCQGETTCAALDCDGLGRSCSGEPFASCGECLDGLKATDESDSQSQCVAVFTCTNLACGDLYCEPAENTGSDATCVESQCSDPGQAWSEKDGKCVTCGFDCSGFTGATGRVWHETKEDGSCVCETESGYYLPTTAAPFPLPCDLDGDGWVRASAQAFVENTDAAIRENARCDLLTIDRIVLRNDVGQEVELLLCADPVGVLAPGSSCNAPAPVGLYESAVLDDDKLIGEAPLDFPAWTAGGNGRALRAQELNPLTKACVTFEADFNANGIRDVEEAQGVIPSGVTLTELEQVFGQFGYFVELHKGTVDRRPTEDYDAYLIEERSRCAEDFALGYDSDNNNGSGSEYWRGCTRSRRASFDETDLEAGHDFAKWQCPETTSGTCSALSPVLGATGDDGVAAHDLCAVGVSESDPWLGMTHHSQFRCVVVATDATDPWEVAAADLSDGVNGSYRFNACHVACPDDDPTCDTDCGFSGCLTSNDAGSAATPAHPTLSCTPGDAEVDDVGFVAVQFVDGATPETYTEGCIDEWTWWPDLCPGYLVDAESQAITGDGQSLDFGSLVCGCGEAWGGPECEIGCPMIDGPFLSLDYSLAPRSGWWLCGDATHSARDHVLDTTSGATLDGNDGTTTWSLSGRIQVAPRTRNLLCESDECSSGWSLR